MVTDMGRRARQSRSRTPRVARLPSNRSRPRFSLELGRAGTTRQPLFRSDSLMSNPRPSRTPLCNPRAVAVFDPEPHPSPSRPSLDPPPRAMAGRGNHQPGALSGALSRKAASTAVCVFVARTTLQVSTECMPVGPLTPIRVRAHVERKSPPSGPGPEGDACADLGAIGRPTVVVLSAGERPPRSLQACRMRSAKRGRHALGLVVCVPD